MDVAVESASILTIKELSSYTVELRYNGSVKLGIRYIRGTL